MDGTRTKKKRKDEHDFLLSFEVAVHLLAGFLDRKYEQILHLPEMVAIMSVLVDRRAGGGAKGNDSRKAWS
jgi:hypothetical protein